MPPDPTVLVVGGSDRRRMGRPRIAPESSTVSARIWSAHHEALAKAAKQRGVSVSEHVRDILKRSIGDPHR